MKNKRALIVAGGTGGHVFPGLAIANELQDRDYLVHWLGTLNGIESTLVPKNGIELHTIPIDGVRGKGIKGYLLAPVKIIQSTLMAYKVIKSFGPSMVFGLGGYVAGPAGLASKIARIPLFIHEQNAIAGSTNKILARFASKVFTAFPNILGSSIWIGNPIRKELENLNNHTFTLDMVNQKVNVLVLGGSRGAQAINEIMPKALRHLNNEKISVWHQTGKNKKDTTVELYKDVVCENRVEEFIDDMSQAYSWSHIVVCRAGALTVSELAAVGVGSVLIPFPYAIDDHQTHNAKFLEDAGAAILVQQSDITLESFVSILQDLIDNPKKIEAMAKQAKSKAKLGVAKKIVDACEDACNVR